MVCLEYEEVAPRQGVSDLCGRSPQVGRDPQSEPCALIDHGDADRISSVVNGQERLDPQVSDVKGSTWIVRVYDLFSTKYLGARGLGPLSHIDRRAIPSRVYTDASGVVGVLVGHDDRIDLFGLNADHIETSYDRPTAEAGIDEDPGIAGVDKDRVAGAAAP